MNIDLIDYFAAKAMQSLLSNETIKEVAEEEQVDFPMLVAKMAYDAAICMLEEREEVMTRSGHDPIQ